MDEAITMTIVIVYLLKMDCHVRSCSCSYQKQEMLLVTSQTVALNSLQPHMQHYLSGKEFGMAPVVGEDYGYGTLSYYAVAVVKKSNTDIQFHKLEGKKTCHTGAGKTAGWNVPVGTLLAKKYIKYDSTCNPYVAAGNYFKESCVPSKK